MFIHCPHISRKIDGLVAFNNEQTNLDFFTDDGVENIFVNAGYETIIFPYSRFVCDVERFVNDEMDAQGMGIIYTKDVYNRPIKRKISDEDTMKLYKEHHLKFNVAINKSLALLPKVVIVDAHSFSPFVNYPIDICIGTDSFHTPSKLKNIVVDFFKSREFNVALNDPYSGTFVPSVHYHITKEVESIMIEFNKKLINNGWDCFDHLKTSIRDCLSLIQEYEDEENLNYNYKM
jgi:N-formylglutamate deformylase